MLRCSSARPLGGTEAAQEQGLPRGMKDHALKQLSVGTWLTMAASAPRHPQSKKLVEQLGAVLA